MLLPFLGLAAGLILILEVVGYVWLIPDESQRPVKPNRTFRWVGTLAYGLAYVLSLLRAPLGLLPYLVKLFIIFGLRIHYEAVHTNYARELLNMLGEFANLGLTYWLVWALVGTPAWNLLSVLCYLPVGAELIRLAAERIPAIFTAAWQLAPHRRIAQRLAAHKLWSRLCGRYCRYYALADELRAAALLRALKQRARLDPDVTARLAYIESLRIVPMEHGLRIGAVRNVATGEVYIHKLWTSDPWLLAGMALRRAPWPFDPRYQRRPFYYMSGANRLTSLFVLQQARYCLPYACFQFGHEVRVARLHCFYVLLRWLGVDCERRVWSNGLFLTDQFIYWLQGRLGSEAHQEEPRALYQDEEVIAEVRGNVAAGQELPGVVEIATRYVYPRIYVEEVLLGKIREALIESGLAGEACASKDSVIQDGR